MLLDRLEMSRKGLPSSACRGVVVNGDILDDHS
jgi:hypothetical protein